MIQISNEDTQVDENMAKGSRSSVLKRKTTLKYVIIIPSFQIRKLSMCLPSRRGRRTMVGRKKGIL